MSDGMNDSEGTSWERKIKDYFDRFNELVKEILEDEPQLKRLLIKRIERFPK